MEKGYGYGSILDTWLVRNMSQHDDYFRNMFWVCKLRVQEWNDQFHSIQPCMKMGPVRQTWVLVTNMRVVNQRWCYSQMNMAQNSGFQIKIAVYSPKWSYGYWPFRVCQWVVTSCKTVEATLVCEGQVVGNASNIQKNGSKHRTGMIMIDH